MADEVEMIPVTGTEPPKADPLAKPATVKLNPVVRPPTAVVGAPSAGLKPGLKLPPKPSLGTGLKLPAKPGAGTALRPGLKLPTQTALKPGLKIPSRPVIRKPGEAAAAAPLPKPMEALKSVTQKLKGITQEIPQQAVLHKTGIIAETGLTDAQKEAAKHKTARISLSDAMGVAPVKDEAAPMKTIRIKRPVDVPTPAAAPADSAAASELQLTQRKTLKVARPGGTAVRPGGKFSIKRPGQATTVAQPAASTASAADGEVADIPEIPATATVPVPVAPSAALEGPSWVWTLSSIVQFAACVAMGALVWFFYENSQLPTYCGGLGWGQ